MISVLNRNKIFDLLFGEQEIDDTKQYKLASYCIYSTIDSGILLYNNLSKELLVLNEVDLNDFLHLNLPFDLSAYLKKNWFLIPENIRGNILCDQFINLLKNITPAKKLNSFTIMTTMECNARCFYCFQKGRFQPRMTTETALKVADYILDNCDKEKPIKITWFGGEPLFNEDVIDIICKKLKEHNRIFFSKMVTNGFLINKSSITKYKEVWNLKSLQITLDGSENIYNHTKNYIYKDKNINPFKTVVNNIDLLLKNDFDIIVRLNFGLHNADDLYNLSDFLSMRFSAYKNFKIYVHRLFDYNDGKMVMSEEVAKETIRTIKSFKNYIIKNKMNYSKELNQNYTTRHCMADSDSSLVITPEGYFTKCEHFSDKEIIGDVFGTPLNQEMINSWKERQHSLDICETCAYYIDCIRLKKCPDISPKCDQFQKSEAEESLRDMLFTTYRNFNLK